MGLRSSSTKDLDNRPLKFPLALSSPAQIIALQAVPERHLASLEESGRVFQLDYNKTVVGWIDAQGNAFRNDYQRTKVGRVDLTSKLIYQADYNETLIGRVDGNGLIYACSSVVHESVANTAIGKVVGPEESYPFAACALVLLL